MRSAYPAVFFCALACASVPSTSRLSSTGTPPSAATVTGSSAAGASARGQFITGSFTTEYFGGETLYDVLRRRAPLYLRPRGTSAQAMGQTDPIAVYIDGSYSGSVDVLQLIPAYEVFAVDRISAIDASIRYGPKHSGGALLVKLIRHD